RPGEGGGAIGRLPGGPSEAAGAFQAEQDLLAGQAAAVADEGAVRADEAVAGGDDGDRVAVVGGAHGAGGARGVQRAGDVAVARGAPVGDRRQPPPDLELEGGAGGGQPGGELPQLAGEVGAQLLGGGTERSGVVHRVRRRRGVHVQAGQ